MALFEPLWIAASYYFLELVVFSRLSVGIYAGRRGSNRMSTRYRSASSAFQSSRHSLVVESEADRLLEQTCRRLGAVSVCGVEGLAGRGSLPKHEKVNNGNPNDEVSGIVIDLHDIVEQIRKKEVHDLDTEAKFYRSLLLFDENLTACDGVLELLKHLENTSTVKFNLELLMKALVPIAESFKEMRVRLIEEYDKNPDDFEFSDEKRRERRSSYVDPGRTADSDPGFDVDEFYRDIEEMLHGRGSSKPSSISPRSDKSRASTAPSKGEGPEGSRKTDPRLRPEGSSPGGGSDF